MTHTRLTAIAVATTLAVAGPAAHASDLMVGVNPPDGATALAKRFHVATGTSIAGVTFGSNDSRTVFPEVFLVRGAGTTLGEGIVVATATNVAQNAPGPVVVVWSPISVPEDGDYLVVIRFPQGSRNQGPGNGAALRALEGNLHRSAIVGSDGSLNEISVDLDVSLLTAGVAGKAVEGSPPTEAQERIRETFLVQQGPHPAVSIAKVRFGIANAGFADLTIFDIAGRQVRSLVRGYLRAGERTADWDGRDDRGQAVAAGVYLARLHAEGKVITQKVVLAK